MKKTYCGADLNDDKIENILDEMGEIDVGCRDELKYCLTTFLETLSREGFLVVKL